MKHLIAAIVIASVIASPAKATAQCATAVATADAARTIYLNEVDGKIAPGNDVVVKDEGDHWSVFQFHTPEDKKNPDGTVTVTETFGGGTLELDIDKCTGATRGHYSK